MLQYAVAYGTILCKAAASRLNIAKSDPAYSELVTLQNDNKKSEGEHTAASL